jgi:hyperosmotically inducible protein
MTDISPRKILSALALTAVLSGGLAACSAVEGRQTAGEYIDDSAITAKVKSKIVGEPSLSAMQINVETMKGVVQLSGFVDQAADKTLAARVAAQVDGVRSVKNNIVVRG